MKNSLTKRSLACFVTKKKRRKFIRESGFVHFGSKLLLTTIEHKKSRKRDETVMRYNGVSIENIQARSKRKD